MYSKFVENEENEQANAQKDDEEDDDDNISEVSYKDQELSPTEELVSGKSNEATNSMAVKNEKQRASQVDEDLDCLD